MRLQAETSECTDRPKTQEFPRKNQCQTRHLGALRCRITTGASSFHSMPFGQPILIALGRQSASPSRNFRSRAMREEHPSSSWRGDSNSRCMQPEADDNPHEKPSSSSLQNPRIPGEKSRRGTSARNLGGNFGETTCSSSGKRPVQAWRPLRRLLAPIATPTCRTRQYGSNRVEPIPAGWTREQTNAPKPKRG